jgi:uncharacterized protein (TIGR03118 family)
MALVLLGGAAALSAAPAHATGSTFTQTNLVSDIPGLAATTDPDLVNAWGISHSTSSPFWVSDNAKGVTTLYNGEGTKIFLNFGGQHLPHVVIPPPKGSAPGTLSTPTGQVFNTAQSSESFKVSNGTTSARAVFIFATEDGTISGWNPSVDPANAVRMVDNSASGAVYKGLAIGSNSSGDFLYAANFHAGTIDVFGSDFKPAHLSGSFTDPDIKAGFAPFNIQNLDGNLYVTYAKQDADAHDDVAGPANGYVDVYNTDGVLLKRLASHGRLDSPWGLAIAPKSFGRFAGDLLAGNFGDGRVNVVDLNGAGFLGQLRDADNRAITIDGLWGLIVGNGGNGGDPTKVYFSAGPNGEAHGLFGSLTPNS